jgi:hypothetical protein
MLNQKSITKHTTRARVKIIKSVLWAGFTFALLGAAFIYSGLYPVGADTQHNKLTYALLETVREQSIARASSSVKVPDLSNPDLLLAGGPDYNEMCATCHLKPGVEQSDMSIGLYPTPPNLAKDRTLGLADLESAQRDFCIIKHGIKASGMPAWGPTHDDARIWAMVAFINKLPNLATEHYQILTARSEDDSGSHH